MIIELLPNLFIINKKKNNNITRDLLKYKVSYILKMDNCNINIDYEYCNIKCIEIVSDKSIKEILNNNYKYYNDKLYECILKNNNILLLLDENNIVISFLIIFIIYSSGMTYLDAIKCIKSKYKFKKNFNKEQIEFFNHILKN